MTTANADPLTQLSRNQTLAQPVKVCLVTMGSYPHYHGGVSTWCDMLINGLPDVNFELMSFTANPSAELLYKLPTNVANLRAIPLWGTSDVLEMKRNLGLWDVVRHKISTNDAIINAFVPTFRRFLQILWGDESRPYEFGRVLYEMAHYFMYHDYDATMKSLPVWDCFVAEGQKGYKAYAASVGIEGDVNLLDVTDANRLLYRWLTLLTIPIPQVDIVHTAMAGLCCIPGILAKEAYGTSFLLTEHGVYLRERLLSLARHKTNAFDQVLQARFEQHLNETSYKYADKIAPGSNYNHRWELQNGARAEQIQTIYNGPDPAEFTPGPYNSDDQPPKIIFLGRLDPLKDIQTLVASAAVVHREMPEAKFKLYGKAPKGNEAYFQQCLDLRAQLGLEEVVEFAGFADTAESAYNEGDFVILSSISEGFPYSVVEAMMCGRTVVGTAVGGVPEALEGVGLVVQPRDPEAMGQACLQLLRDREMTRELGRKAREKALQQFSLQQCNAAYAQLYEQLRNTAVAKSNQPAHRWLALSSSQPTLKPVLPRVAHAAWQAFTGLYRRQPLPAGI
jgi:polysaccharide biosynthesis protein PelF